MTKLCKIILFQVKTKQEIKNGDQQLMNNDAQCEALEKEI